MKLIKSMLKNEFEIYLFYFWGKQLFKMWKINLNGFILYFFDKKEGE